MQASQGAIKYAGLEYIIGLVKIAADSTRIPIALHLDHGTSFEQVVRCIRGGFSSVMFDGSQLPLEENIRITNKVLDLARPIGVSVEAELGKIGGTEDDISVEESLYTDPREAEVFVKETGVDALAMLALLTDSIKVNPNWILNDWRRSENWLTYLLFCTAPPVFLMQQ